MPLGYLILEDEIHLIDPAGRDASRHHQHVKFDLVPVRRTVVQ